MGLTGLKVLVTRLPQHAQPLIDKIQAQKGLAWNQPLFAVEPLLDANRRLQQSAFRTDLAIFVSPTAVAMAMPLLDADTPRHWAAIGAGTADALLKYGVANVIYAHGTTANSRMLLAKLIDTGFNMQGLRCMIFSGADGDSWLPQNLQALGATVETIPVYRRVLPPAFRLLPEINLILITCVTSLVNLQKLAPTCNLPLLVVSDRIKRIALEMGYATVYNSKGAADDAILAALMQVNHATERNT